MDTPHASKLLSQIVPDEIHSSVKVSVIGAGKVGMAVAYSLLLQGSASELALIDEQPDKLKGEMMDLQHGQAFLHTVKVVASTDFSAVKGSQVCIITAGAKMKAGESDKEHLEGNLAVFKHIIPNVAKHCPNCILIIVSKPVEVLTWASWKLSGFPENRIIGIGTMVDSSRFRFLLSEKIGIAPKSCHGYMIGELGDNSVPIWSSVNIAGTRLKDIQPFVGEENDPEDWNKIHQAVVESSDEIIALKGYTSWSLGIMVSNLVNCMLKNQKIIYTLTTLAKGYHGIGEEIFLSLPCVVGEKGVVAVFNQNLEDKEVALLKQSAKRLAEIIKDIRL